MARKSSSSSTAEQSPDRMPGPLHFLYAIYAYIVFIILALTTLLVALITPGLERRRWVVKTGARTFLRFAGMPLNVKALETVPAGQCVIVANHASYLDGLVFKAALPPRFGFVIKREMASVPLAGAMLKLIGSEFVERFNRSKGASDARRVLRNAVSGHSLVFFPEGTFSPQPGLLKFHSGAFTTAARAGCPVVPAVIRGTRKALPAGSVMPRPSRIEIEFLPPVIASAETDDAAVELRNRSRSAILDRLHEPDLAAT
jgi:1-acyl-sn-glycerol-3-phosphate acyltransferase